MNRNFFPEQTHFIGVLLPEELTIRLQGCRDFMHQKYGCRSGHGTPLHVTLVPPFCLDEKMTTADIETAVSQMVSDRKWHPFNAKIDGFDAFGDRTLFAKVLPSAVWTAFRSSVYKTVSALSPGSLRQDNRLFQPHITVANRDIPAGVCTEVLESMNQLEMKVTFPVNNITIFERVNKSWVAAKKIEL